jgi:hypothetical protein
LWRYSGNSGTFHSARHGAKLAAQKGENDQKQERRKQNLVECGDFHLSKFLLSICEALCSDCLFLQSNSDSCVAVLLLFDYKLSKCHQPVNQ